MPASPLHPPPTQPAIGDYAIIGDCRSAALVSRHGSIDWLCWPRFDSPSLFCAILDPRKGGHYAVRPAGAFGAERRYVGDTNVLETTFRTAGGVLRLTDLMPVDSEEGKRRALAPQHEILRRLECVSGEVEVEVVCEPRPDYARATPRLRDRGRLGICHESGPAVLVLRGDLPLALTPDGTAAAGRVTLRAGERRHLSLAYGVGEPAVLPCLGDGAEERIRRSLAWWEHWAACCTYDGPWRDAVRRSALALKLMTYAPSGAVIAAPTTSLPEQPGGVRNWDYRYCWLRDASLTLQALFDLGYPTEAESFLSWLIHTTRLSWPELRILYTVYGRMDMRERELEHLAGFAGSRPVRVGNAAKGQLQLDVYGEVLDAVFEFVRRGGRIDRVTSRMLAGFGRTVCRRWREPDEGIWEVRSGRRHHTYSKVMCWAALDRLVRLHDAGRVRVDRDTFARTRDEIRRTVEAHGFDESLGSYVSVLGAMGEVDASLLQLGRCGYVDPASPRMRGTVAAVRARIARGPFVYRYHASTDDGLPPGEGAFGICSFWGVRALAQAGSADEAARQFEHLLSCGNDVGLYAEQIDPATGAAQGNFPQAFTHVGLIDAALTLHPVPRPAAPPSGEVERVRKERGGAPQAMHRP